MTHTIHTKSPGHAPLPRSTPEINGDANVQQTIRKDFVSSTTLPLTAIYENRRQPQSNASASFAAKIDTFANNLIGCSALSEEVNLWLACNELERFLESCPPQAYEDVRLALSMLEKQRELYRLLFDNSHALLSA